MPNTLGGLRWIEMKKASVMITSWEAWWDGDHNKVIGLQEEHLVFCLFAITVAAVRWERNLEVDKLPALWVVLLLNTWSLEEEEWEFWHTVPHAQPETQPTTLLADLSARGQAVSPPCMRALCCREASERSFIFCFVQFISQPEFGRKVVGCVVGNGTNGRQVPEDPILVLMWRAITCYLRRYPVL